MRSSILQAYWIRPNPAFSALRKPFRTIAHPGNHCGDSIGSLTFCPVSWSMQVKERIADNQAQPSRNLLNHQRSWFPHVVLCLGVFPGTVSRPDVSVVLQKTCRVALDKRVAALQHWPFFTPNVFRWRGSQKNNSQKNGVLAKDSKQC